LRDQKTLESFFPVVAAISSRMKQLAIWDIVYQY
jgi:hypothetical protein